MTVAEPVRHPGPYCDLCGDASGVVIEVDSGAPADDQRRERWRHHHQDCVDRLRAHEAEQTRRWREETNTRRRQQ